MADSVWQLSWPAIVAVLGIILIGGVVRGFGGFGASMIWVLVTADEHAMRATLAVLVLLTAASMATKFRTRAIPGARVATGVGVVSGP